MKTEERNEMDRCRERMRGKNQNADRAGGRNWILAGFGATGLKTPVKKLG